MEEAWGGRPLEDKDESGRGMSGPPGLRRHRMFTVGKNFRRKAKCSCNLEASVPGVVLPNELRTGQGEGACARGKQGGAVISRLGQFSRPMMFGGLRKDKKKKRPEEVSGGRPTLRENARGTTDANRSGPPGGGSARGGLARGTDSCPVRKHLINPCPGYVRIMGP